MGAPFAFTLPPELSAKEPPERRGVRRDQVGLLIIERATGKIEHTRFDKIDRYLRQKDLLVFNSSRTLPASLRGCSCGGRHGPCMEVRLAEHCRTIPGWRFFFASRAILSAADYVRVCKSNSRKDSTPPCCRATRAFRVFGNCTSRFPGRNSSI